MTTKIIKICIGIIIWLIILAIGAGVFIGMVMNMGDPDTAQITGSPISVKTTPTPQIDMPQISSETRAFNHEVMGYMMEGNISFDGEKYYIKADGWDETGRSYMYMIGPEDCVRISINNGYGSYGENRNLKEEDDLIHRLFNVCPAE